jgi:hypothetical protein
LEHCLGQILEHLLGLFWIPKIAQFQDQFWSNLWADDDHNWLSLRTHFGALFGLSWSPNLAQFQDPFWSKLLGICWSPKLTHFQDPFCSNFWAHFENQNWPSSRTHFGAVFGPILKPKTGPVPGPILEQILGLFWRP